MQRCCFGSAKSRLRVVNKFTRHRPDTAQTARRPAAYAVGMSRNPTAPGPSASWVAGRLAAFHGPPQAEPVLRDWLQASRDVLFRWTMAMATSADARRVIAEMAVSIQRLRGTEAFDLWLYGAALQAALHQQGGLPEGSLSGMPPELRALLRLVAQRTLRREEAMALLAQRMGFVRSRLVHTRLASQGAPAPLDGLRTGAQAAP